MPGLLLLIEVNSPASWWGYLWLLCGSDCFLIPLSPGSGF